MSRLKKLVLALIVLVMLLPIFVLLYTTILFGNPFIEQQWWSAIVLGVAGLFLVTIADALMKWLLEEMSKWVKSVYA